MSEFDPYIEDLHVAKFGGSSMLEMEHVQDRMEEMDERRIAVVSALGKSAVEGYDGPHLTKVTDDLIKCRETDDEAVFDDLVDGILEKHRFEARRLNIFDGDEQQQEYLLTQFWEDIVDAKMRGDDADLEIQGEIMAARLFAAYSGHEFIDPREVIVFGDPDENGHRTVDLEMTSELLREQMSDRSKKYVMAGYGGADYDGNTVLFPRSGTDVSAAVVAVVLGATTYENFKEFDGVFTTDPRKEQNAQLVDVLTYDEARDLGVAGSEVLHKDVIRLLWDRVDPTVYRHIKTRVRSVTNPDCPGTLIIDRRTPHKDELVKALNVRDDYVYLKIHEYEMNDKKGYIAKVAKFAAEFGVELTDDMDEYLGGGVSFDHLPTATDSLTLVMDRHQFWQWTDLDNEDIDDKPNFDDFVNELDEFLGGQKVESYDTVASVHLVGMQHAKRLALIQGLLGMKLDAEEIELLATGGGQFNTTSSVFFIDSKRVEEARRAAHETFFPPEQEAA